MIYSNEPDALSIASFCYRQLNLIGEVTIETKPLEVDGYCYDSGLIEINDELPREDFLVAICHEMVHYSQYEQGRGADETEAYNLERKLYLDFLKYEGIL
jgi:hypothetical protein